jgi:hypothetical protein
VREGHPPSTGGDQLYNDMVFSGPVLAGFDQTQTQAETDSKLKLPFTQEMKDEVEEFYFAQYCVHFSRDQFSDALASIPSLMVSQPYFSA